MIKRMQNHAQDSVRSRRRRGSRPCGLHPATSPGPGLLDPVRLARLLWPLLLRGALLWPSRLWARLRRLRLRPALLRARRPLLGRLRLGARAAAGLALIPLCENNLGASG